MTAVGKVKSLLRDTSEIIRKRQEKQETGIKTLLGCAARLLEKQKRHIESKGEKFNVFRILGMESKENRTHTAFISELLKPEGSHLQENKFLDLFLIVIGHHAKTTEPFDATSATVKVEKDIGKIDRLTKTGGRIDIYIEDKNKTSISIENKIYAGDQPLQIVRYGNHNKKKNTVYYLTLDGRDPSLDSREELAEGKDYFNISYRKEIIQWLEWCWKESAGQPILRETIRQYILLIGGFTSIMQDEYQKSLFKLMLENYEAAKYVAENFDDFKKNICQEIFDEVEAILKTKLPRDEYSIKRTSNNKERILIELKGYEKKGVHLIVEVSARDNHLFVGIENENGEDIHKKVVKFTNPRDDEEDSTGSPSYPRYKYLTLKGRKIDDLQFMYKLCSNDGSKKELVEDIAEQVKKYICGGKDEGGRGQELLSMFRSSQI